MTTREQAIGNAAQAFAEARALRDSLPAAEAARLAWTPTGPSLDEIEQRIAATRRTQTPAPAAAEAPRPPRLGRVSNAR
jgi:hypothetical protein